MTGSEFARRVGVTPTAVWNWETNGTQPRSRVLSMIAMVLGVSESFLKIGTDSNLAGASHTVPEIVEDARNKVALATGLAPSQIRIRVELVTT
jgi:transcriptional regulator with XRE-family HTH domain